MSYIRNKYLPELVKDVIKKYRPSTGEEFVKFSQALYDQFHGMDIYCQYWDEESGLCLIFPESDERTFKTHGKHWILVNKFVGKEVFDKDFSYDDKMENGDVAPMAYDDEIIRKVEVIKIIE